MIRRILQFLVLAVIVVLLPLTLMGVWVRQEIYDVDRYLESVSGLASQPEVQQAVAERVVNEIEKEVEGFDWPAFVQEVVSDPEVQAEILAIETEIAPFLEEAIVEVMASPDFEQLWIDINREAHPILEQVLRGEDTELLESSGGVVRLNLYPVYRELESALFANGIDLSAEIQVDPDDFWLTIFEGDRLVQAQAGVELLNRGIVVGSGLLLGLAVFYLLISRRRWLASSVLGLAVFLGMILHGILLGTAREFLTDAAATGTEREAVRIVFDEITDSLWQTSLIIGGIGLGVLVLFLIGHFVRRRDDSYAIHW